MPNQPYFPSSDAERVIWLGNFRTKLPLHAAALVLAATEVSDSVADINSSSCFSRIIRTSFDCSFHFFRG